MSMKTVALVAHDNKKPDLMNWANKHKAELNQCNIVATGTTGGLLEREVGLQVRKFKSGPLGGDQQIGALIAEQQLDLLIFFWDPLNPAPHDPDVKALLRLCSVWNIPVACNLSTADLIMSSMHITDERFVVDYPNYDI